jgi:hypothetical protein
MFSKQFIFKSITLSGILFSIIFISYTFYYNYNVSDFFNYKLILIIPLSIILHEFFHLLGFAIFDFSFKGITFGISKNLIPYTRKTKKLSKTHLIFAAILPFIILGLGSLIISLFFYDSNLITFALINISGCSGDFLIIKKKLN